MTNKSPLGSLEPVELREYWGHEAHHFTPWLVDNIDLLGSALGLNLEVEGTEVGVGPFRADILARDIDENTQVLIENQLEPSDFSHIGQIVTYSAGLDAATIVWITKGFVEEHRAALDWLNRVTLPEVNFFGIRIELWRIGDSDPAPRFHVISRPNEWSKKLATARRVPGRRAALYDAYEDYWSGLANHLVNSDYPFPPPKASARNWIFVKAELPPGLKINASSALYEKRIHVYLLVYGDQLPGFFSYLEENTDSLTSLVGTAPERLDRSDRGQGGYVEWSFSSPSETADHEDEFAWAAGIIPRIAAGAKSTLKQFQG